MTEARAPTFNSKPEVQKIQKRKLGNSGLEVSACQQAQTTGRCFAQQQRSDWMEKSH
jgi:hypothetical protein